MGYSAVVNGLYQSPEVMTGDFAGFTRTINIQEVDPADLVTPQIGSGLKRVDISVQWGAQGSQQINMTTLIGMY